MRIDSSGRTRRKNPHQLTLNQHVLPRSSIQRYAGHDGLVDCFIVPARAAKRLRSNNPVFCADRVWAQVAESGPMPKRIEGDFNQLAGALKRRGHACLDSSANLIATKFYALVTWRERLRDYPPPEARSDGRGASDLSLDDQERLEKIGYLHAAEGVFSSRMVAAVQIMGAITWAVRNQRDTNWGLLRSEQLQFVIPDRVGDFGFIPLGPREILAANCPSGLMSTAEVAAHNAAVRASSRRYYFAEDLSQS